MRLSLLAAGLWLAIIPARADVLLVDTLAQEPPNAPGGLPRPTTGMSADQVVEQFGEPLAVSQPVGDPPISRWDYPDFSVFFEYDRVIDSVVHRKR
ncbi:MAG TPA: hypothetical protein ENK54_07655 [Thiotrichales bacterium]|nr:hypothetical protein [Thiotrichales bacterium]